MLDTFFFFNMGYVGSVRHYRLRHMDILAVCHWQLHCFIILLNFNYITISCVYLFLTPNSHAGVSLNIHSFMCHWLTKYEYIGSKCHWLTNMGIHVLACML